MINRDYHKNINVFENISMVYFESTTKLYLSLLFFMISNFLNKHIYFLFHIPKQHIFKEFHAYKSSFDVN